MEIFMIAITGIMILVIFAMLIANDQCDHNRKTVLEQGVDYMKDGKFIDKSIIYISQCQKCHKIKKQKVFIS